MDEVFNYWHLLGPLIQREVVMKLNFMDRLKLRATSKREMTLVDSLKKTLTLEFVQLSPRKIKAVDCYGTKMKCRQLIPKALLYVLSGFKIDKFNIELDKDDSLRFTPDHFELLDRELKKININSFAMFARSIDGFRDGNFFLEKCDDNLGEVYFFFNDGWTENVDEIFGIDSVKKMSGYMIVDNLVQEHEIQTMDLWIGMNLSIGSQLEISKKDGRRLIGDIVEHFQTRFIKQSDDEHILIISTLDSAKEVMIVEDCYDGTDSWAYRVTVVPSNLHKSEYEKYIGMYGLR